MDDKRRTLDAVMAYWRTDRQQILKCCILLRKDCEGGSAAGIREILMQTQRSADPHKILDRVLSILRHMPEDRRSRALIEEYAFGRLRGRPPYAVARFWDRVPAEAIKDVAPLAAALLG